MKFLQLIKNLFLKQEEHLMPPPYDIHEQSYSAYKYTFDINGADYTTQLLKTSYVYNSTAHHIKDAHPPVVKNHWGERTIHIKTQLLLVVLHKLNIRPPL